MQSLFFSFEFYRSSRTTRLALVVWSLCMFILTASAQNADEKLEAYFKEYLESYFQLRPLDATRLGDHRFDHLLDDITPQGRKRWKEHAQRALKELPKKISYERLSEDGKVDFNIFKQDLQRNIWLLENIRSFEEDPRAYNDYISDSVYLLLAQSTLPKETNIANAIARMERIPEIVEIARRTLKNPPRPILETAIRQNLGAISFYESEVFQLAGHTPQLDTLRTASAKVVTHLKQYQDFLEKDLLNQAQGDWRIGKKKFAQKLELVLESGFTAQQVLADAEAEFARVERDMYVLARQLWSRYFPEKVLPPDDSEGRRQTILTVLNAIGQEHGKPEDLVLDAQATVDKIKKFIADKGILTLPNPDRCEIIEMPEFRRGNSLAYLEAAPPLEPATKSFYAVSPPPSDWDANRVKSFLEEYNRHMLQVLTIHEAYPGHYVQLEYSNRSRSLIRKILQSGVFVEGWAVYTEQMMLDQGYGEQDLALRLSQLKFYLRAVANAILDHKMHCTQMTDNEALEFLTQRAFQSEGEARLKIIRSKQSSVQLSTYFVGRMAHYRLRQQIQRELGNRFDLGKYHEAVLAHGSIPVKYLPNLVRSELLK